MNKQKLQVGSSEWQLERQRSMMMTAATQGMSNLVLMAIDENPQVDKRKLAEPKEPDKVPLLTACLNGHLEIVQNLVEKCHADVNCQGTITIEEETVVNATPIWTSCYSGNLELIKYLVHHGADVKKKIPGRQSSCLRVACYEGHLPVAKYLVQNGCAVNDVNQIGHSVLMISAHKNQQEVVQFLLDNGADVNYSAPVRDESKVGGETALFDCAREGHVEIAKLLVAHGATVERSHRGETALMNAAHQGHRDMVLFLADTPDCSRDDKADALELLGAAMFREKRDEMAQTCLELWQQAMDVRYQPGKPVAEKQDQPKVNVLGDVLEYKTPEELRKLQSTGDPLELLIQGALIHLRVLGKHHEATNDYFIYLAANHMDKEQYEEGYELVMYALDNLSQAPTVQLSIYAMNHGYGFLMCGFFSHELEPSAGKVLPLLKHMFSSFLRVDAQRSSDSLPLFWTNRQTLLQIIVHYFALAGNEIGNWTPGQQTELLNGLTSFLKKDIRGEHGETLLHLAVDKQTTDFDDSYEAFTFPSIEAVQMLLKSGCDVNSKDEKGQTALQFLKEDSNGEHANIISFLESAGAR